MNIIEKEIAKISTYFTVAELKATMNAAVMPLLLMVLTNNVAIGICWVLFITVIYKTIQKEKRENAREFFKFLFIESIVLAALGLIVILLGVF